MNKFLLLHILTTNWCAAVLDFGHSERRAVVSHYWFNLQLSKDIRCGASFHPLICHLCLFDEVSVKAPFCSFFNWIVCFLMSFKNSFYVFG